MGYSDGDEMNTGWAIRNTYDDHTYLLGRYFFLKEQPESMEGYWTGVFETRAKARLWLKDRKARTVNAWCRDYNRRMAVVKVEVTVKELK